MTWECRLFQNRHRPALMFTDMVGFTARRGSMPVRDSLALRAAALTLGLSRWFSAAAVIPHLELVWELTATTKARLTIAVQLRLVAEALTSAALNIADRVSPRFVNLGLAVT